MQELLVKKCGVEWNLLGEPAGVTGHWITAEELGIHLGYADPRKAINNIFSRHVDFFKDKVDTFVLKLRTTYASGKTGSLIDQVCETRIFSERGALKVVRYSNTEMADQIMDQVFDIFLSVKDALNKEEDYLKAQRQLEDIRQAEKEAFEKLKDIIAVASDYHEKFTSIDFAILQNMLHRAVTGMSAAELKLNRVAANKIHIGMNTGYDYGHHGQLLADGTNVAKNYLTERELFLERALVTGCLIDLEFSLEKSKRRYTIAEV